MGGLGLGRSGKAVSGGVECVMLGLRKGEVLGVCLPVWEKLHWLHWIREFKVKAIGNLQQIKHIKI